MKNLFVITRQNRKILYTFLRDLTDHELFTTPHGFNNNIWWNIAHVVVTQQKLVYGLSDLPLNISTSLVEKYQKGTFPGQKPDKSEIQEVSYLLFELPKKTESDYADGVFRKFKPYMTTPKIELSSIDDALAFNVFHEGLHLGSIMALARAVKV